MSNHSKLGCIHGDASSATAPAGFGGRHLGALLCLLVASMSLMACAQKLTGADADPLQIAGIGIGAPRQQAVEAASALLSVPNPVESKYFLVLENPEDNWRQQKKEDVVRQEWVQRVVIEEHPDLLTEEWLGDGRVLNAFDIAFSAPPMDSTVLSVQRTTTYLGVLGPAVADFVQALTAKFGPPTFRYDEPASTKGDPEDFRLLWIAQSDLDADTAVQCSHRFNSKSNFEIPASVGVQATYPDQLVRLQCGRMLMVDVTLSDANAGIVHSFKMNLFDTEAYAESVRAAELYVKGQRALRNTQEVQQAEASIDPVL